MVKTENSRKKTQQQKFIVDLMTLFSLFVLCCLFLCCRSCWWIRFIRKEIHEDTYTDVRLSYQTQKLWETKLSNETTMKYLIHF